MTYTVRNCRSYSDTTVVVAQQWDVNDSTRLLEESLYGYGGPDRVKKAVKRALQELLWDERQGFRGEVYIEGGKRC